jgi:hypothetical protein
MKPGKVVCRYGRPANKGSLTPYNYPDLCDVLFDHRPKEVSKGHFTYGVKLIEK